MDSRKPDFLWNWNSDDDKDPDYSPTTKRSHKMTVLPTPPKTPSGPKGSFQSKTPARAKKSFQSQHSVSRMAEYTPSLGPKFIASFKEKDIDKEIHMVKRPSSPSSVSNIRLLALRKVARNPWIHMRSIIKMIKTGTAPSKKDKAGLVTKMPLMKVLHTNYFRQKKKRASLLAPAELGTPFSFPKLPSKKRKLSSLAGKDDTSSSELGQKKHRFTIPSTPTPFSKTSNSVLKQNLLSNSLESNSATHLPSKSLKPNKLSISVNNKAKRVAIGGNYLSVESSKKISSSSLKKLQPAPKTPSSSVSPKFQTPIINNVTSKVPDGPSTQDSGYWSASSDETLDCIVLATPSTQNNKLTSKNAVSKGEVSTKDSEEILPSPTLISSNKSYIGLEEVWSFIMKPYIFEGT